MEAIIPNFTKGKENFNFQQVSSCSSPTPSPRTPPAITPRAIIGSSSTTFIHADPSSFKEIVQKLTGSTETISKKHAIGSRKSPVPVKTTGPIRSSFKLYQRRKGICNLKKINPIRHESFLDAMSTVSPSELNMPALALSPVTPAIVESLDKRSLVEEERAIAEKGFYLHPSPRSAPAAPPTLLPLFPATSPSTASSLSP